MAALSAALFLIKWKGALHAVDYEALIQRGARPKQKDKFPTLTELSAEVIVTDAGFASQVVPYLPPQLYYLVMKMAISKGHDRTMDLLLPAWPVQTLSLSEVWPGLFGTLNILYDQNVHNAHMRQGIHSTNSLIIAFLKHIKTGDPMKLRVLDLKEFPTVDLMVDYLAGEIIAWDKSTEKDEQTQNVILSNANDCDLEDHNKNYEICVDCAVRDDNTFKGLCDALKICQKSSSKLRLRISKIDASCLGDSQLQILLTYLQPKEMVGLCIQYNSLFNDGLVLLTPQLSRFHSLQALDLSCNNINLVSQQDDITQPPTGATSALTELLGSLSNLKRLNLSNNRITGKLGSIFSRTETYSGLEYLKLSACVLVASDLEALRKLPHSGSLRELDLSENAVISQNLLVFTALLKDLAPTLQILEIEDCKFTSNHLGNLCSALLQLQRVHYVNIARHSLSSNALRSHVACLGSLPHLECIRLSFSEDCYVETSDSSSYDKRKCDLRRSVESQLAIYRGNLAHLHVDIHLVWTEYYALF